jgi:hypothetical protein
VDTPLQIIGFMVIGLTGAVGALWKSLRATASRTEKDLEQCRAEHKERDAQLLGLTEKVGHLEGMMEGHAQARADLRQLSDLVIHKIERIPDAPAGG